jgi:hypothetical protein
MAGDLAEPGSLRHSAPDFSFFYRIQRVKPSAIGHVGFVQLAHIANVVAFLAGPDGAWINGQVLRANGGII